MMRRLGTNLQVTCKVSDLLAKLRTNREEHSSIVQEAREGFLRSTEKKLAEELAKIRDGKIKAVSIHLTPPQDMTSAYTTVITMLEMHTEETIVLSASDVRMFVEDEWDWADEFLLANSAYSSKSMSMAAAKGLL